MAESILSISPSNISSNISTQYIEQFFYLNHLQSYSLSLLHDTAIALWFYFSSNGTVRFINVNNAFLFNGNPNIAITLYSNKIIFENKSSSVNTSIQLHALVLFS